MKLANFMSIDGEFHIDFYDLNKLDYVQNQDKIMVRLFDYSKKFILNKFIKEEFCNAQYNIIIDDDKVFTKDEIFDILNKLCPYEKQLEGLLIRIDIPCGYFPDIKKGYEILHYDDASLVNIKNIEYFSNFRKKCVYDKNKIKKCVEKINRKIDNEINKLEKCKMKFNSLID